MPSSANSFWRNSVFHSPLFDPCCSGFPVLEHPAVPHTLSLGQFGTVSQGSTWPVLPVRWRLLPLEPRDSLLACDCSSCFSAVKSFQQHSMFDQNGQNCSWQNTKLMGGSVGRRGRTVQWQRVSHRQHSKRHSWGKKDLSIK